MFSFKFASSAGAFLLLAGMAGTAFAEWPTIHRTPGNNAVVPINAVVQDLDASLAWASGSADLFPAVRPTIANGKVFTVAADDAGTAFDGSDDSIWVRAFDQQDGAALWTSPQLDAGNSVANGSRSAVTVDSGTTSPTLYFASGESLQKLDGNDGSIVWTSAIDSQTTSSAAHGIVNSSPSLGTERVFVQTTNFGTSPSLVVAFDQETGNVDWYQETGGQGLISPLYADFGGGNRYVFVDTVTGGEAGIIAYDAETGTEVWNHSTVANPWGASGGASVGIYTDMLFNDGKIYAISFDFSAAGKLIRVDAATGDATSPGNYVVNSIGTDTPPVLINDTLYAIGGAFGDADLVAYDTADGTVDFTEDLGFAVFRNYIAGMNDRLYFTNGDGDFVAYDLSGSQVSASSSGSYSGPVTIDDAGVVYTITAGGDLEARSGAASVRDWKMME